MQEAVDLGTPLMQYGFGGIVLLLIGVIVWMFKQLRAVIHKNNDVLAKVEEVMRDTHELGRDQMKLSREINNRLLQQQPCMMKQ